MERTIEHGRYPGPGYEILKEIGYRLELSGRYRGFYKLHKLQQPVTVVIEKLCDADWALQYEALVDASRLADLDADTHQ